jgi:hypothetical protein
MEPSDMVSARRRPSVPGMSQADLRRRRPARRTSLLVARSWLLRSASRPSDDDPAVMRSAGLLRQACWYAAVVTKPLLSSEADRPSQCRRRSDHLPRAVKISADPALPYARPPLSKGISAAKRTTSPYTPCSGSRIGPSIEQGIEVDQIGLSITV